MVTAQRDVIAIDRAHGGNARDGFLDFSTSLNPFGPPAEAIAAYHAAADAIARYPEPYPRRLEARIASWLGVDPEMVLAGNGSTQLIYLVARTLRLRAPHVVIPTFSEIANALHAASTQPVPIILHAENDFRVEAKGFEQAVDAGAEGILLGRPNSPTGSLIGIDEIGAMARACSRRDAWVVVDEAFIEFADDPRSAVSLIGYNPNLVVSRSLTKIFALAGLRLGYLVGAPELVRKLRDSIEPWSVNAVAERVAGACLEVDPEFIASSRRRLFEERKGILTELTRAGGLRIFPSRANFFLIKVDAEPEIGDLGRFLRGHQIVIRDLSALPGFGPGFYRIGLRAHADNALLIAAIGDYFASRTIA